MHKVLNTDSGHLLGSCKLKSACDVVWCFARTMLLDDVRLTVCVGPLWWWCVEALAKGSGARIFGSKKTMIRTLVWAI